MIKSLKTVVVENKAYIKSSFNAELSKEVNACNECQSTQDVIKCHEYLPQPDIAHRIEYHLCRPCYLKKTDPEARRQEARDMAKATVKK